MSLSAALDISNTTERNDYINHHAWIRYFDHGVVLLNPTDAAKTIHLVEGDYYRFLGRSSTPGSRYFSTHYSVNDGNAVEDNEIVIQPREGLFLVRKYTTTLGDVSCDGQVDDDDALVIMEYDVGLKTVNDLCQPLQEGTLFFDICDVSGDNECDLVDALFIMQCSRGISNVFCPDAASQPLELAVYQHGVDGYTSGEDTHIVTTNWEPPTPHDTYHVLYLRTSSGEDEIKSSIIRFDDINLPPGAQVTSAVLSVYYQGQSVNGGEILAHVSATKPTWEPPETTWVDYQSSDEWQEPGAKGVTDRESYTSIKVVDYTEVGAWLDFSVTQSVQNGVFEFTLYASDMGVNKHIYFPSNEYWDASKRPKLMIWYE